jgi:hypothetical protein
MSIYRNHSSKIYGIQIYRIMTINGEFNYEKIFEKDDFDDDVRKFYDKFKHDANNLRSELRIQIYTECFCMLDENNIKSSLIWYPISEEDLIYDILNRLN